MNVAQKPKTVDDIFTPWKEVLKRDGEFIRENLYTPETRTDFDGVYLSSGLDIDVFCENYTKEEWQPHNPHNMALDVMFYHSYGVADNISQILNLMDTFHEDLNVDFSNCVVLITHVILKDKEPKTDGWRWCKWGSYIGEHHIQHEYIADEPDIKMVFCFDIVKLSRKSRKMM